MKDKIQKFLSKDNLHELLDREKISKFLIENSYKIQTVILSVIAVILLWLIGFYSYKAYKNYNIINEKINRVAVIKDKKILSKIKQNNLRTINSLASTTRLLYGEKYTNDFVAKEVLLKMASLEEGERYGKIIKISLLTDIKGVENVDISELIKNADNDEQLKVLLNDDDKTVKKFKENYKSLVNSNLVRGYISAFPKVKFSDKHLSDVISKLYVYELPFIEADLKREYELYNTKLSKYQAPYENFLKDIFFPSVNIWQDKYSWKINTDLFGWEYLKEAKYIDINLINYWTNFFKYAYSWKNYKGKQNEIQDITIWKFKPAKIKWVDNIVSLPVNVKFGVKTDSSFYGLVSKLTSTSNVKNVMLISEFTYYLWENIKSLVNAKIDELWDDLKDKPLWWKYMVSLLKSCEEWKLDCRGLFACDENCSLAKIGSIVWNSNYEESLTWAYVTISKELARNRMYHSDSPFSKYFVNEYYKIDDINKLIWARLSDCINDGFCDDILTYKTKWDIVARSIEDFAGCTKWSISKCVENPKDAVCNECRYKFANKFDTNYFIVYTLVNNMDNIKDYTFVDRLKDVYKNIPGLLRLGNFKFSKVNNPLYAYDASVNLEVYYRFLSNKELADILAYIWEKRCSPVTDKKAWSIKLAKKFVSNKINNLYNIDLWADEVYNLKVLQDLINKKEEEIKKADNMEKLLANLQIYRIFLERWYCENK